MLETTHPHIPSGENQVSLRTVAPCVRVPLSKWIQEAIYVDLVSIREELLNALHVIFGCGKKGVRIILVSIHDPT